MTTISVEQFRAHVDRYLAEAAQDTVVVTQNGNPWIVLRAAAANGDAESMAFATSAEFWQMIQQRRQEQGIPWEQAKNELDLG